MCFRNSHATWRVVNSQPKNRFLEMPQIAAVVSDEQWLPVYEVLHLLFLLTDKTVDQTGHEGFPGEYQSGLKGDLKFLKDNDQPEPEYSCRRDGCPRDDHMGMDLVQQSIKRGKGIACWKEIEKW